MKILILDDDLIRHGLFRDNFGYGLHDLTMVTTVDQAISKLALHVYDAVFLDHDLGGQQMVVSGGKEPTGWDVAKWLKDNPDRCPKVVIIHSFNPDGAQNMKNLLPQAQLVPGLWNIKQ